MQSISNLLNDYFDFINPKRSTSKISTKVDKRSEKINNLVNQITGDGNISPSKIIGIKALISEDNTVESKDKSYQKTTMHQFYSPSSEF